MFFRMLQHPCALFAQLAVELVSTPDLSKIMLEARNPSSSFCISVIGILVGVAKIVYKPFTLSLRFAHALHDLFYARRARLT
ncbi:Hypothetical Protein FCC1311_114492 [Hondaea fermentalgiana]|uniref:Uncharacterized protein n=1 Tax=Hondaea fermentalgiana TaxID=2315210 RepID=A0A2R5GWL0_9STRA|nr:Hypothetical Protein FCC1311_114492 [Hondaea fermentalgiana]|eukprot:GBG35226.1 Hypothetical Protein FCC1311_114492 [Hondaea fermentalgiana]